MNFWKNCPLLVLVVASGLLISIVSLADPGGIYENYEKESVLTPPLAAFFWGIREKQYPWQTAEEKMMPVMSAGAEGVSERIPLAADFDKEEALENPDTAESALIEGELAAQDVWPQGEAGKEASKGRQPSEGQVFSKDGQGRQISFVSGQERAEEEKGDASEEGETAERQEKRWVLGPVEEDYFEDALFIGDSRTQGLFEYGGFSENVTFYSKTSLTVYDLFKREKAFIKEDGKNLTLEEALAAHSFRKIYLMLGINEMGTGTAESFFEEYARAVYRIQSLQPDAVIFVQGIMHVGAKKNASDKLFNNRNIEIRNVEIATLANDQNIFYLDINEVFCDENGNLFDGWSNDQIHLKAKYYAVWKDYLMEHGAVEEPPDGPEESENLPVR